VAKVIHKATALQCWMIIGKNNIIIELEKMTTTFNNRIRQIWL